MGKLEWREISDSDGTTICYVATGGRAAPRQPYDSYRIFPEKDMSFYAVELWRGTSSLERIGSVGVVWSDRRGERTLSAAKQAAQNHYKTRKSNG